MAKRLVLTLGLAALFGAAWVQGQGGQPNDPPDRWRAWAVTAGGETKLVVEGIYRAGGPGTVALVKPATPQGINPKILILDVKLGTLPGVWPAILQPIPAHYTQSPYKAGTYDSIHVRYSDGASVMIERVVDAGEGPKGQ